MKDHKFANGVNNKCP